MREEDVKERREGDVLPEDILWCSRCRVVPARPDRLTCPECGAAEVRRVQAYRKKLQEEGRCMSCGAALDEIGRRSRQIRPPLRERLRAEIERRNSRPD